ncbi:3-oxoacyl-[acyl-carrier-protein] reductase [Candidatus Neoehrlichia procyonis]|uniref:3-oxoacyl-[acyl-carrier-protein] reductase n=1 Tax=Candidatus Neoehrlichia procyonis str. RAC413 TaxID=1359163 RepID=A0A0F3NLA6_9RICK|nr:3-oxoacyl-[acyl-carrier-protein] reductase [Candidatus Neoehrlichia lotoris]KJV68848.1 3-oxoacyl-[acyl-carrier-protein] reductase [Candidatus Neoehrlichia lotoris str. RAC413]
MFSLLGKKFLITGASGGIGKAIAVLFSDAGAEICLSGTRVNALQDLSKECKNKTHVIACNLSINEEIESLVNSAVSAMSGLDGIVCNAGITLDKLTLRMSNEDWDKVINFNLSTTFKLNRNACKALLKNNSGRIINISSVVGITGNIGQVNYAASKAGIIAMSKSIALEFANRNITVNCIAPGFIDTPMTSILSEKQKNYILEKIPMKRMGTPKEVAAVALFLASDVSQYITGQTIHVNGGMI